MEIRQTAKSIFCHFALAAMLVGVCGCRSNSRDWKFADMFDLKKGMPWHHDGPETGIPNRVVGTWTDTVLTQPGKKPQRGFGGRLLFYDNESNEPISVDGQLVVYAFDESDREVTDNKPTRRYVFPADQVPLHMSESELGPSYSFWLPWDEVGGPQTEVSLICRFEPKGGPLIVGEETKHLLPGELVAEHGPPKLPEGVPFKPGIQQALYSTGNQAGDSQMQAASYDRPVSGTSDILPAERHMETTSISLPQSFRVQGSPAAVQAGPTLIPNVRSTSNVNMRGGVPVSQSGVGMIPSAQNVPSPVYGPRSQVTPIEGYPVAAPAPVPSTQLQPITPVGTNALAPAGPQAAIPQSVPQYPQQPGETNVQNGLSTTVTMLTPGESARRRWGQPSLNSTPAPPPAPAPPASR